MKVTIEIEDGKLHSLLKLTKQKKNPKAVVSALDEFIENRARQEFLAKVLAGHRLLGVE